MTYTGTCVALEENNERYNILYLKAQILYSNNICYQYFVPMGQYPGKNNDK
jgi:hypothetical protein